jgi:hypothetical protein
LQLRQRLGKRRDERVEQLLFAAERALLRRERLVLERLQFGRDVALRVLERLAAPVVGRDALDVRVRDLDVEPVHAVVLDLEVRDAGALALAPLEVGEEFAAVAVDGAELVELAVVAVGDDAAVANVRRRLGGDRAREHCGPTIVDNERGRRIAQECGLGVGELIAQFRQCKQRGTERGQLARANLGERDARRDPLDVRHVRQRLAQALAPRIVGHERGDGVVARRRRRCIAQRAGQPFAHQAAAGRADAGVEQGKQRGLRLAGQRARDLEVAARRGVQRNVGPRLLDGEPRNVRERGLLRRPGIVEQCAGRAGRDRRFVRAERAQVLRSEMLRKRACAGRSVEVPGRSQPDRHVTTQDGGFCAVRDEQLGRLEPLERRDELGGRHVGERDAARREVQPGHAGALALHDARGEHARAARVEQRRVDERARRHDARDAALDRPLARRRIAELLDYHGRRARAHELREMLLDRMVGNARHRDRGAGRLSARRERQVERA